MASGRSLLLSVDRGFADGFACGPYDYHLRSISCVRTEQDKVFSRVYPLLPA